MSWLWFGKEDDRPLHVEVRGNGTETVVFLAGLGGTTRYWASRVAPLEKDYRVVLIDLLGFGESPKPWTTYDTARHVAALRRVLKPFGTISLIGHSLGALLTVAYAARHPDDIKDLTVIGMPVFGSQEGAYRYMRHGPVRGGIVYTNVLLTMIACLVTRRLLGWLLPYVVRSVPREVAEDLVKHTWRSSTSSLWEVVYRYDVADSLASLPRSIGVLFIHGSDDLMAPLEPIERLAATRPQWRLWIAKGVDHHPLLREPAACIAMIRQHVSGGRVTDALRHPLQAPETTIKESP